MGDDKLYPIRAFGREFRINENDLRALVDAGIVTCNVASGINLKKFTDELSGVLNSRTRTDERIAT